MKDFASDNTSGVHPAFLRSLEEANAGHVQSYGLDPISLDLTKVASEIFRRPVEIFCVFNGTAANVLSLAAMVKPHNGVICAESSHLHLDECGGPERWLGTKLLTVPSKEGKIHLADVEKHLQRLGDQHFVQPKVLSIAQPTEWGTVYSIQELLAIRDFCKKHSLYFHMDGARLANAAVHLECDLADITTEVGVDVLSFGGTKNGMLGAEAVVFINKDLAKDFKFIRKQGLQLAAKHRFLACQFRAYLKDGLWREIAHHQNQLTQLLERNIRALIGEIQQSPKLQGTVAKDLGIAAAAQSNALFVSLPKEWIGPLKNEHFFYVWDESQSIVRWMVTWDHTETDIASLTNAVAELALKH